MKKLSFLNIKYFWFINMNIFTNENMYAENCKFISEKKSHDKLE